MDQAINFLLMGESRSEFIPQSDNAEQNNDTDLSLATALQQEELNKQIRQPESGMYRPTSTHRGEVPRMVATDSFLTTSGSGPFCTCVAASIFLDGGFITAESLNSMLQGGIELFRKANGNTKSIDKILSKFGKSRLGIEAVAKQAESRVLIAELGPLGVEIAKNIVLAGCKELVIFEHPSTQIDCSTRSLASGQFFLDEDSEQQESKALACKQKL